MKHLIFLVTLIFCFGCVSKLDVGDIDVNDNVEKHRLDSYPSLNKIIMDVELPDSTPLINYYTKENISSEDVHYNGIPVDSSWGFSTFVNKGKFVDLKFYAKEEYALTFANVLYKKLGNPSKILNDRQTLKDSITYNKFYSQFPNHTKWLDGGTVRQFSYPYAIFWNKPHMIHIFSLSVDYSGEIRNNYKIISKEAYRDGIFYAYGLFKNLPQDSPLYEYLNE